MLKIKIKQYTNSICIKGWLIGSERGEVGSHARCGCSGSVGVWRAVHGQRHARREPLVVEELVLARAHCLTSDRVLEYWSAGVAAARRCGSRRAGSRRAARAARSPAHSRLRRRRTVGGCRYGAL